MKQKNYYARSKKYKSGKKPKYQKNQNIISRISPGADSSLKKIFSGIGVPEQKEFVPDDFQIRAVEAIEKNDCLVTAPTGSGKTWIAEKAIQKALDRNEKVWYGTPLKALTNTIYAEFSEKFGKDKIGILTGDIKMNNTAPIIIGTTEILRNILYDSMRTGESLSADFVILDEAHFLGDADRGVVWEEIMIYLPTRIPLLMLSATIGNANDISQWLSNIRGKKCVVIEETKRAVPLQHIFFHPSGTLFPLLADKKNKGMNKKAALYADEKQPVLLSPYGSLPPIADIMKVLKAYNLLPAIFFMKSRIDCDKAIELCSAEILLQSPEKKQCIEKRLEELLKTNKHISGHKQRYHLENMAVGAHHSGQLPSWKVVIETLMSEGLLDAIFATSTVAAGVNFPARTVVILNSDRFNGVEFQSLTPSEFSQMTGRAGRRGKDKIGFTIALPGKFMNLKLLAKLANSTSGDITSQIKIDFSMALNLLLSHSPDTIKKLLKLSFAEFLHAKKSKSLQNNKFFAIDNDMDYLWRDFLLHLEFLKSEGFADENNKLTEDGIWAANLRIDSPLLVAEGFRLKAFPENNPALLAGLISSFVNERMSDKFLSKANMPKKLLSAFLRLKKLLSPFAYNMMDEGFDVSPLFLKPALTIYMWATGSTWDKVIKISGLAEGDLARLIMRTADNLHHISNLNETFPVIAKSASKAYYLIMREPVI